MEKFPDFITVNNQEAKIARQSTLSHRINAKNLIKGGIGSDVYLTSIHNMRNDTVLNNCKGNSNLLKAFVQWQYRFSNTLSMTPCIYSQLYTLNNDYSIEPRIGFKWDASPSSSFSLGGGLHSQLQPRIVYMYEEDVIVKNKNLGMTNLNFGDDFYNNWDYVFVNEGTGRNYGAEITLEKFLRCPCIEVMKSNIFLRSLFPLSVFQNIIPKKVVHL